MLKRCHRRLLKAMPHFLRLPPELGWMFILIGLMDFGFVHDDKIFVEQLSGFQGGVAIYLTSATAFILYGLILLSVLLKK